jgi:hypothetical protein
MSEVARGEIGPGGRQARDGLGAGKQRAELCARRKTTLFVLERCQRRVSLRLQSNDSKWFPLPRS